MTTGTAGQNHSMAVDKGVGISDRKSLHISEEALKIAQKYDDEKRLSGNDVKTMPILIDPYRHQNSYRAKKMKEDEAYRRRVRNASNNRFRERYRTEPAFRQKMLDRRREYGKNKRDGIAIENDIKDQSMSINTE